MGEPNCLLLLEWLTTTSIGLVRLPSLLFCRTSLLSALGGCLYEPRLLGATSRLFQSSGVPLTYEIAFHDVDAWAGALAHSLLR